MASTRKKRGSYRAQQPVQVNGLYVHASPPKVVQMNPSVMRQWLRGGDLDKLEQVVLEGQGARLVGEYSPDPKTRSFLRSIPSFLTKIDAAHAATTRGQLMELQDIVAGEKRIPLALAKDRAGVGLLHKAVFQDHGNIIEWLIEAYPPTVNAKDREGRSPLHYCGACADSQYTWRLLLEAGADPQQADVRGRVPAYYMDNPDELRLPASPADSEEIRRITAAREGLIVKPSNIRIWIHDQDLGRLKQVLWEGQGHRLRTETSKYPAVKKFLEFVPYAMNAIRDTHSAAITGDLDAFISRTAPPAPIDLITSKDTNGLTPLHKAVGLGNFSIMEEILKRAPRATVITDNLGRTALHYSALLKDQGETYNSLIREGADELAVDNLGRTAEYYRGRPGDLDPSLLRVVPDAPRTSASFPPTWDWNVLASTGGLSAATSGASRRARKSSRTSDATRSDGGSSPNSKDAEPVNGQVNGQRDVEPDANEDAEPPKPSDAETVEKPKTPDPENVEKPKTPDTENVENVESVEAVPTEEQNGRLASQSSSAEGETNRTPPPSRENSASLRTEVLMERQEKFISEYFPQFQRFLRRLSAELYEINSQNEINEQSPEFARGATFHSMPEDDPGQTWNLFLNSTFRDSSAVSRNEGDFLRASGRSGEFRGDSGTRERLVLPVIRVHAPEQGSPSESESSLGKVQTTEKRRPGGNSRLSFNGLGINYELFREDEMNESRQDEVLNRMNGPVYSDVDEEDGEFNRPKRSFDSESDTRYSNDRVLEHAESVGLNEAQGIVEFMRNTDGVMNEPGRGYVNDEALFVGDKKERQVRDFESRTESSTDSEATVSRGEELHESLQPKTLDEAYGKNEVTISDDEPYAQIETISAKSRLSNNQIIPVALNMSTVERNRDPNLHVDRLQTLPDESTPDESWKKNMERGSSVVTEQNIQISAPMGDLDEGESLNVNYIESSDVSFDDIQEGENLRSGGQNTQSVISRSSATEDVPQDVSSVPSGDLSSTKHNVLWNDNATIKRGVEVVNGSDFSENENGVKNVIVSSRSPDGIGKSNVLSTSTDIVGIANVLSGNQGDVGNTSASSRSPGRARTGSALSRSVKVVRNANLSSGSQDNTGTTNTSSRSQNDVKNGNALSRNPEDAENDNTLNRSEDEVGIAKAPSKIQDDVENTNASAESRDVENGNVLSRNQDDFEKAISSNRRLDDVRNENTFTYRQNAIARSHASGENYDGVNISKGENLSENKLPDNSNNLRKENMITDKAESMSESPSVVAERKLNEQSAPFTSGLVGRNLFSDNLFQIIASVSQSKTERSLNNFGNDMDQAPDTALGGVTDNGNQNKIDYPNEAKPSIPSNKMNKDEPKDISNKQSDSIANEFLVLARAENIIQTNGNGAVVETSTKEVFVANGLGESSRFVNDFLDGGDNHNEISLTRDFYDSNDINAMGNKQTVELLSQSEFWSGLLTGPLRNSDGNAIVAKIEANDAGTNLFDNVSQVAINATKGTVDSFNQSEETVANDITSTSTQMSEDKQTAMTSDGNPSERNRYSEDDLNISPWPENPEIDVQFGVVNKDEASRLNTRQETKPRDRRTAEVSVSAPSEVDNRTEVTTFVSLSRQTGGLFNPIDISIQGLRGENETVFKDEATVRTSDNAVILNNESNKTGSEEVQKASQTSGIISEITSSDDKRVSQMINPDMVRDSDSDLNPKDNRGDRKVDTGNSLYDSVVSDSVLEWSTVSENVGGIDDGSVNSIIERKGSIISEHAIPLGGTPNARVERNSNSGNEDSMVRENSNDKEVESDDTVKKSDAGNLDNVVTENGNFREVDSSVIVGRSGDSEELGRAVAENRNSGEVESNVTVETSSNPVRPDGIVTENMDPSEEDTTITMEGSGDFGDLIGVVTGNRTSEVVDIAVTDRSDGHPKSLGNVITISGVLKEVASDTSLQRNFEKLDHDKVNESNGEVNANASNESDSERHDSNKTTDDFIPAGTNLDLPNSDTREGMNDSTRIETVGDFQVQNDGKIGREVKRAVMEISIRDQRNESTSDEQFQEEIADEGEYTNVQSILGSSQGVEIEAVSQHENAVRGLGAFLDRDTLRSDVSGSNLREVQNVQLRPTVEVTNDTTEEEKPPEESNGEESNPNPEEPNDGNDVPSSELPDETPVHNESESVSKELEGDMPAETTEPGEVSAADGPGNNDVSAESDGVDGNAEPVTEAQDDNQPAEAGDSKETPEGDSADNEVAPEEVITSDGDGDGKGTRAKRSLEAQGDISNADDSNVEATENGEDTGGDVDESDENFGPPADDQVIVVSDNGVDDDGPEEAVDDDGPKEAVDDTDDKKSDDDNKIPNGDIKRSDDGGDLEENVPNSDEQDGEPSEAEPENSPAGNIQQVDEESKDENPIVDDNVNNEINNSVDGENVNNEGEDIIDSDTVNEGEIIVSSDNVNNDEIINNNDDVSKDKDIVDGDDVNENDNTVDGDDRKETDDNNNNALDDNANKENNNENKADGNEDNKANENSNTNEETAEEEVINNETDHNNEEKTSTGDNAKEEDDNNNNAEETDKEAIGSPDSDDVVSGDPSDTPGGSVDKEEEPGDENEDEKKDDEGSKTDNNRKDDGDPSGSDGDPSSSDGHTGNGFSRKSDAPGEGDISEPGPEKHEDEQQGVSGEKVEGHHQVGNGNVPRAQAASPVGKPVLAKRISFKGISRRVLDGLSRRQNSGSADSKDQINANEETNQTVEENQAKEESEKEGEGFSNATTAIVGTQGSPDTVNTDDFPETDSKEYRSARRPPTPHPPHKSLLPSALPEAEEEDEGVIGDQDEEDSRLGRDEGRLQGKVIGDRTLDNQGPAPNMPKGIMNGNAVPAGPPKPDPEVDRLIARGDLSALAELVLNGEGHRLVGRRSEMPELQSFIENVPVYMAKIQSVHDSARSGQLRELQAALDRRKFAVARDPRTPAGATPLHAAVLLGQTAVVRYLAGRFPETLAARDARGRAPLHCAAALPDNGHYFNLLLNLGADRTLKDNNGRTASYYMQNPGALTHKQLLAEINAPESIADESFTDKVPNDEASCRRCVEHDSELTTTMDKYYDVIQDAAVAARADMRPITRMVVLKYLTKPIFDQCKYLLTRMDHGILNVIWPVILDQSRSVEDRLKQSGTFFEEAGIVLPDYESYLVFSAIVLPVVKHLNGMDPKQPILPHPPSQFFEDEDETSSIGTAVTVLSRMEFRNDEVTQRTMDLDPTRRVILHSVAHCTRNLEDFNLPLCLTLDELRQVERILRRALLTGKSPYETKDPGHEWDDLVLSDDQGTYYPLEELADPLHDIRARLRSAGQWLEQPGDPDRSVRMHGKYWPLGRGVFVTKDGSIAAYINVQDHLRVMVAAKEGQPGKIGLLYRDLGEFMIKLDNIFKFKRDDILGYLAARPWVSGNSMRFKVTVRLPKLGREPEHLIALCKSRRLRLASAASLDVFHFSNRQCLGITECQTYRSFVTAVANILQLEHRMEANGIHFTAILGKFFRKRHQAEANALRT